MANEASERQRRTTVLVASQSPAAAASDGFDDCHRSAGQCEVICFAAGAGSNWLKERRDFVGQLTRRFQRQGQGKKVRGTLFVCDLAGRVCCTADKSSVAVQAREVLSTANEKVSKMS